MSKNKVYIGDGVYAEALGFEIMLTTENGVSVSNTIYLTQREITNLIEFAKSVGMGPERD